MNIASKSLFAFYIFVILIGITLRFVRITQRTVLFNDETTSYLSATGHQGEVGLLYEDEKYPIGNWASASEWKHLIRPEKSFVFQQIAHDLAHFDIHPPLYFWLLHLWTLIWNTNIWTGLLLNISIDLVILFILLRFAFDYLEDLHEVMLVAAGWILGPISIATSAWIRHYVLFTLFTLLFVYLLFKFIYLPERVKIMSAQHLILAIVTAAGLLTNYYFALVILTGVAVLSLKYLNRGITKNSNKARLVALFVSLSIAGILFALIYPDFYSQLLNYSGRNNQNNLGRWIDLGYRIRRTVYINSLLFSHVILMLILVTWNYVYTTKTIDFRQLWSMSSNFIKNHLRQPFIFYVLSFAILTNGAVILLYLTSASPQHAMASRYVSFISPFVTFIPVFILRLFHSNFKIQLFFCTTIMVLGVVAALVPQIRGPAKDNSKDLRLSASDIVVVDNLQSQFLLSVAFYLKDETEIFAASQKYLINHQQNWLSRLSNEGGIYISTRGKGSTEEGRKKILDLINNDNTIIPSPGIIWEKHEVGVDNKIYRIMP